jgi:hypothetical protein
MKLGYYTFFYTNNIVKMLKKIKGKSGGEIPCNNVGFSEHFHLERVFFNKKKYVIIQLIKDIDILIGVKQPVFAVESSIN